MGTIYFERQPDSSFTESRLCRDTADRLAGLGWPMLVLDATEQSPQQLAEAFRTAGYTVTDSQPGPGEYGVMIVSRVQAEPDQLTMALGYLPAGPLSAGC